MRVASAVVFLDGGSQRCQIILSLYFLKDRITNKIGDGFAFELRILPNHRSVDIVYSHRHRRHFQLLSLAEYIVF